VPVAAAAAHETAPTAAEVAGDDKGISDAAEKVAARRAKQAESKTARKEKGHGKGKR
jgi:hypothetical protein